MSHPILSYLPTRKTKPTGGRPGATIAVLILATAVLAALAFSMSGCTNPYVPAGHEGYVFERPRLFGKGG